MSPEDKYQIPTKNNEYVLHTWFEHEFVVDFTYYTFDVDLMCLFVGLELFCTRM